MLNLVKVICCTADVVRFHGVQKFEELRNQAKQGFGRMEKDGRIGGQPVDDDFPIPMDQLQTFDEGGDTSTYEQTFGQPFTMGQRYGSMGAPQNRGYELITYTSPDGKRTIVIPHFNGKPMSAVPTGFTEQGGAGDTAGGSGVGMTDDEDRIDDMEAQRLRNIDQPVVVIADEPLSIAPKPLVIEPLFNAPTVVAAVVTRLGIAVISSSR